MNRPWPTLVDGRFAESEFEEVTKKMGRVFDALRRAAELDSKKREHRARPSDAQARAEEIESLLQRSEIFSSQAREPQLFSASAEHADVATAIGSALPENGWASRVAGATVDAERSARVASFPALDVSAARADQHLIAITQPQSPECEQFRSLRTHVLHAGEKRQVQAVVITSAGVLEGKTVTAINLAWLLAQTDGVRALLIDGDLRRPCALSYLGLDRRPGLSEVLAGEAELDATIVRLEPAGLYLLPGGSERNDVAEMLSGPRFSSVLAEVRRMFDYIVIDAPPLGIFTDATVLINRADAALIVVRAGYTRYSLLDRLLEPLPRERLLGIVLNGVDETLDEHSYYYRRYYRRAEEAKKKAVAEGVAV
jgi:capsular exopolysaccharide synthesis family protein